jgi:hypothetical protein
VQGNVSDTTHNRREMLDRICGEYREQPGLGLRLEQARRLWDLDLVFCGELLESLVETRFLRRAADGRYIRRGDGRG